MGWEWVARHLLREVMITESLREIVFMYVGCDMPLYAFSLFLPTIINQVCHEFCTLICGSKSKFSAWIHGHPSKPSHRSSLCFCLYRYMSGRIFSGSSGSEGLFQYRILVYWSGWLHHPHLLEKACPLIFCCLHGNMWNLPRHSKHNIMGIK